MRVMGCAPASWIEARVDADGTARARCASESDVTRGFGAILCDVLRGGAEECLALEDGFVDEMEIGLGSKVEKLPPTGLRICSRRRRNSCAPSSRMVVGIRFRA